jgi:hypothetical protein
VAPAESRAVAAVTHFDYFTSQQLAELTGMSHAWILRQARRGVHSHHRDPAGGVHFTDEDLRVLAARGTNRMPPRDWTVTWPELDDSR